MILRVVMIFDSVNVDDDFAVRASPPRDAAELCRAEEGVRVGIKAGCERPDAEYEPRGGNRGSDEKETAVCLSAYCIEVRVKEAYLENTAVSRI